MNESLDGTRDSNTEAAASDSTGKIKRDLSDQLSRLRRRFGNNIVDVLIEQNGGIENDLATIVSFKADELLTWTPDKPPTRWRHDDIEPLESHQLVTDKLPSELIVLGAAIQSAAPGCEHDQLLKALLELAQILYPALLLQSEPPHERDVRSNPIRARVIDVTKRVDELLRAEGLFPERVDRRAFQGNSTFNEYRNLEYFYEPSELLVHAAWELCLLRGEMSQRTLGLAIHENLERLRTVNAGQNTVAPVFLGFAGVEAPEPFEAEGVRVIPYTQRTHSSLLDPGQRLERFDTPGFVVEVARPWEYALVRADETPPPQVDPFDWEEIKSFGEVLVAGHLLASVPNQLKPHELAQPQQLPPPPTLRWVNCADPINRGVSHYYSTGWPLCPKTRARHFDRQSVENAVSLRSVRDQSFQIAVRRIAAALEPYRRWSDSLVDAVIGWESLSGDCKGDVSFRVCAIIAQLVSAQGHRKEIRTILQKVYAERSRVVHAGKLLPDSQCPTAASLAGLVALRRLTEVPALLKAKDRFSALCMHP